MNPLPLNECTVVGLGELLWDCIGDRRHPGGAPANVAFHARQLGADGVVCSRVGADAWGAELLAFLEEHGLSTEHVQRDAAHMTGRVTVHLGAGGAPSYTIHEHVAWDHMAYGDAWAALMARASAVCFGTLAQRAPASRAAIRACLEAAPQALRVYDVNLRPPHFDRAWIEDSLRRAQVFKLNIDEMHTLDRLLGLHAPAEDAFARAIAERYGVRYVFITRGGEGCYAMGPAGAHDEPGIAVAVADTVGAGDAFTAALIAALLEDWPLGRAARFANRCGALVASYPGAMPELREAFAAARDHVWRAR